MAQTARVDGVPVELDDVAWQFLRSEFASEIYADWPIDRRLDGFLRHHGYRELRDDGSVCNELLDRVMVNIRPALREGVLPVVSARTKP